MQHNFHTNFLAAAQRTAMGGLAVRTALRGGVCVDVNEQVQGALQTLTNAFGGTTTAVATPATVSAPTTING